MKHGITNATFACIFCDIAKAFDCASHEVLLSKLEHYWVMGIVLNWFRSYLNVRKQRVSLEYTAIHCFQSAWESMTCRDPQDSILGPMLFNIWWVFVHHWWNEKRDQLDATQWFIELIICSTCFGHHYAHHQELVTIQMFTAFGTCHAPHSRPA